MNIKTTRYLTNSGVFIAFTALWYFNCVYKYKIKNIEGSIVLGLLVTFFFDCSFFQDVKLIIKNNGKGRGLRLNRGFILRVILLNILAAPLIFRPEGSSEIIFSIIGSLLVAFGFLAKVYQSEKRSI